MANGSFEVGNKSTPRKPGQSGTAGSANSSTRNSGAMSQQRGDSGNVSAPQKFVQLVGYRDPKARPETWVRPRAPRG